MKNNKGISMMVMIVTIMLMLIISGILIVKSVSDQGLINKTTEAQFRTEILEYNKELAEAILKDTVAQKNRIDKFNEKEYEKIKKIIPSFHEKYENILIIEEDKLVYIGKDENLYKISVSIGLLEDKSLKDDQILEHLQPFITEWTVNENDTITLPISGICNFEVDYGDGTEIVKVISDTDENRIHTYKDAGTYTITIKGKCTQFNFSKVTVSKDKITKIVQWGVLGGEGIIENFFSFSKCSNLKGPIPSPSLNSFVKVKNFSTLFQDCVSLTGSIPENLFANCPNVYSFGAGYWSGCFMGCTGLTGSIPENLFANLTKIETFNNVFYNCKNLTGSIPENLFKNNLKVTGFQNVFGRM